MSQTLAGHQNARSNLVSLFGLRVDNLSMAETLDSIDELIAQGGVHQHVAINVDKVVKAQKDAELRDIINRSDLVNVDGQAVVWAARLLGVGLKERVAGIDLMVALCERAARRGYRVYFLGARAGVLHEAIARLCTRFPELAVAGCADGYWAPEEEDEVARRVASSHPTILFVAMGSPRKEYFLNRWKGELEVPFVMGVGGALDVIAGRVRRAPKWMQRAGLEWLYRLLQEPRRLWRRYLVDDPRFALITFQFWWSRARGG